jgi:NADH dehydrogenase
MATSADPARDTRHRVVVVGGGFGGLDAVKALRGAPVDITLIDRENHHLFQPLTYQVATGALSPDEVAEPLRALFRRDPHVRVMMAEITGFDLARRVVVTRPTAGELPEQTVPYDTLVVAAGSAYSYFGHDEWRPMALEVKSLASALRVRGRILEAFEAAALESDPDARASYLTFVVVGAGPTGVEMAGQIAELAREMVPREYPGIDEREVRILLVERDDRVLPPFPPALSAHAARSLTDLGVTPTLGRTVVGVDRDGVELTTRDGTTTRVPARTIIWAAGVTASPLGRALAEASGSDVDAAGRVAVEPDLTLPGHPEVLAIGDMVRVRDARTGEPRVLPGLAPVAKQEGRYAGRLIRARLAHRRIRAFRYRDKGSLATIGRARAVADLRGVHLSGFAAWVVWLAVHIVYLIGFENRTVVLIRWAYSLLVRGRGARIVIDAPAADPAQR